MILCRCWWLSLGGHTYGTICWCTHCHDLTMLNLSVWLAAWRFQLRFSLTVPRKKMARCGYLLLILATWNHQAVGFPIWFPVISRDFPWFWSCRVKKHLSRSMEAVSMTKTMTKFPAQQQSEASNQNCDSWTSIRTSHVKRCGCTICPDGKRPQRQAIFKLMVAGSSSQCAFGFQLGQNSFCVLYPCWGWKCPLPPMIYFYDLLCIHAAAFRGMGFSKPQPETSQ